MSARNPPDDYDPFGEDEATPVARGRVGGTGDIHNGLRTAVTDARAPVHAGDGPQYIYNITREREWEARIEPAVIPADTCQRLSIRFVEPAGFPRAAKVLEASSLVLVTAPPGSGKRAAGIMLLTGTRAMGSSTEPASGPRIRELPVHGSDDGPSVLTAGLVEDGDRLLLDLGAVETTEIERRLREFAALRSVIVTHRALAVVVVTEPVRAVIPDDLSHLVVRIARPDRREVFRRHAAAAGIALGPADLNEPKVAGALASASMSVVSRLAEYTCQARERGPDASVAQWLNTAAVGLTDYTDRVQVQLDTIVKAPARALLFAVAMLEGCRIETVVAAERELLRLAGHQPEEISPLERTGLRGRLGALGAEVDGQRRVRFQDMGYSEAVRAHFWNDFPELTDLFREWVKRMPQLPSGGMTPHDGIELANRFAAQALRTGRARDIRYIASSWVGSRGSTYKGAAATLVARGLQDKFEGWRLRVWLYELSRKPTLGRPLSELVLTMSIQELGPTFPGQAFTRLRNLMTNSDNEIAASAGKGIVDLAVADSRLFRDFLQRVTSEAGTPSEAERNNILFLALVAAEGLTAIGRKDFVSGEEVRQSLRAGWRNALDAADRGAAVDRLNDWLDTAARSRNAEVLLDVLVESCDGRFDLLGRLWSIIREWAGGGGIEAATQRGAVRDQIERRIEQAQRLDEVFLLPTP